LAKAADRKFGGYSKGMKRKLTIAAGIIHTPEILFLDEPTTGMLLAFCALLFWMSLYNIRRRWIA
jgi:ABC-2 type transport system ATP-binding protein